MYIDHVINIKEALIDGDYQAREPNRVIRMQGLVERAFSKDCIEEIKLTIELR